MEKIVRKFFPDEDWEFFDDGKLAVSQSGNFVIRQFHDDDFIGEVKSKLSDRYTEAVVKDPSLEVVCQQLLDWGKRRTVNYGNWIEEAIALYGDNHLNWRFKCPKCGESQSIGECHQKSMIGVQPIQLCGSCGHFNPILNPVVIESPVRNHFQRTYVFEFDKS
ncbi:hypothetical protein Cl131_gp135 [Aphanizomenon phage vB_AphaS-CL131]|nr:hypothetical protein Cl131_gp135 [Aphanizomenon phage vB_AphaS-CL131]